MLNQSNKKIKNIFKNGQYVRLYDQENENKIAQIVSNQLSNDALTINNHLDYKLLMIALSYIGKLDKLTALNLVLNNNSEFSYEPIKCLGQSLKKLMKLRYLSLNIKYEENQQFDDKLLFHLGEAIFGLQNLEEFSLELKIPNLVSDEAIQSFNKGLISLSKLTSLTVIITNVNENNIFFINEFCKTQQHLVGLTQFIFKFDKNDNDKNLELDLSCLSLQSFVNLQKLKLDLKNNNLLQENDIYYLQNSLSSLKSVKSISLFLRDFEENQSQAFNSLVNHLLIINSIEKLKVFLELRKQKENPFIIGQLLVSPTSMKSFELQITNHKLNSNESELILVENIICLQNLEKLFILSEFYDISVDSLVNLEKLFQASQKFEEFTLNARLIGDLQNISIGNGLQYQKNLKNLNLGLIFKELSKIPLYITFGISHLNQLKTLKIEQLDYFLDENLSSTFKQLTELTHLEVQCYSSATNKDLESFGHALFYLKKLKYLELIFPCKDNIDNIENIVQNISLLESLQILKLDFSYFFNSYRMKAIKAKLVVDNLKSLKNLQELTIDIQVDQSEQQMYFPQLIEFIIKLPLLRKLKTSYSKMVSSDIKRKHPRIVTII